MLLARRHEGRFFGRRVNCEQVPLLPAWAVADVLNDPREIRYLLVWKSSDGTVWEAVYVTPHREAEAVEVKRRVGPSDFIATLSRPLPRNGGSCLFLICPYCQIPRRALYGWEPGGRFSTSAVRSTWGCRACNQLLRVRGRCACPLRTWSHRPYVRGYFPQ
jgi:hypothetical protein